MRRGEERERFGRRVEVADYIQVAARTLDDWAYKGIGPPYIRVGGQARYRWADVERWLAAQQGGGDAA